MQKLIGAYLLFAAISSHAQTSQPPSVVLNSANGRFAFGQVGTFRSDQYLLDTQTGRLWKVSCIKGDGVSCETLGLLPAIYVDANGSTAGTSPPNPGTPR